MKQTFYYNGTILTMEGDEPQYVESVLTEGGVILAAGEKNMLMRDVSPEARKVNLKGKALLPAFIDAHAGLMKEAYAGLQENGRRGFWNAFQALLKEAARYARAGFTLVHGGRVTGKEYLLLRLAGVCGLLSVDVVCEREVSPRRQNPLWRLLTLGNTQTGEGRTARIHAWSAGLPLYRYGAGSVGQVGGLDERQTYSPYEMLREVTIDAAYLLFEEEERGSIRAGKDADFVILDRNPLEIGAAWWKNVRILKTIKRDKKIAGK